MKYKYWFSCAWRISNKQKEKLLQRYKSARNIYQVEAEQMVRDLQATKQQLDAIEISKRDWDLEEEFAKFLTTGMSLVTKEDEEYPNRLRYIFDSPYGLFFYGTLPTQEQKMVSIVGARRCTPYGKLMAQELGRALGERGIWVVSGMAKGIDGYAHEGCLSTKTNTIAVLGSGVNVCYPKEHKQLYRRIVNQGCVMSEYPPNTQPLPAFFPQRNRIISGLADHIIVVEAKQKSGSLITADLALEQGKDIWAVPGRIGDVLSDGTNRLIAQGAGIITDINDFLCNVEEIDTPQEKVMFPNLEIKLNLEKEERLVYSCFDFYPKSIETALADCPMDLLTFLSHVMTLCDKGYLKEYFKNQYVRIK